MSIVIIVLLTVVVLAAVIALIKAVRIVPQSRAGIVERLGKYQSTLNPGLHFLIPFIDRLLPLIDLREQVVPFPAQSVITEDNLVVGIDTVVYFQVTDPRAATYEITNYIQAVDELTSATLRNVVGGLNLEETLTSRDKINAELRGVLDSTTGRWGIRISRVDIKEITPPPSIQDSMEKQMRAERDRRAAILTAEGEKQSQILTAEGERQAAVLSAEGDAKAAILRADGEAQAIAKVFDSIHRARPTQKLLAYQYIQTLPKVAEGTANKVWMIPAELSTALRGVGSYLNPGASDGPEDDEYEDETPVAQDLPESAPIVAHETVKVTEKDLEPDLTLTDPSEFEMPDSPYTSPIAQEAADPHVDEVNLPVTDPEPATADTTGTDAESGSSARHARPEAPEADPGNESR